MFYYLTCFPAPYSELDRWL